MEVELGDKAAPSPSPQKVSGQITSCTRHWQKILNLEHWRISHRLVDGTKLANALMEVQPTRERNHATIFIRKEILERYSPCSREFQQLLVHELTHLIYDPIAEEHGFQLDFHVEDIQRMSEDKVRFTRVLERAVEHTAQMLCKALPVIMFFNEEEPPI